MTVQEPPVETPVPVSLLPPPPVQDLSTGEEQGAEQAAELVKVNSSQLPTLKFGHTPLSGAFRHIEPTWRNYIVYVDAEGRAGSDDAKRFVTIYQSLPPKERLSAMPEQICELASVSPADLMSWVARQTWMQEAAKSNMALSFLKSGVIAKTAQFAQDSPDNYKHAELFMKASGLLPVAQGRSGPSSPNVTVPIFQSFGTAAGKGLQGDNSGVLNGALRQLGSGSSQPGELADMDDDIVSLSKVLQEVGISEAKTNHAALLAEREANGQSDDDEDDDSDDDEDEETDS